MIHHIPPTLLLRLRERVVVPLKDAMRLKEYKENERNCKFHRYRRAKGSEKENVYRSYSFKLKGTLKHEMYLKALNPARIKSIIGNAYNYKVIMKPDRPIDMEYDSKNKRSIEVVVYFKRITA